MTTGNPFLDVLLNGAVTAIAASPSMLLLLGLMLVGVLVLQAAAGPRRRLRRRGKHPRFGPPGGSRKSFRPAAIEDAYEAARQTGDAGEKAVAAILEKAKLPSISDLVLPVGAGTTQIDHVVLAGRTLVCLETKTWNGLIFGGAFDPRWTVVAASGRKHQPQNPLAQNRRHVTALRARFPDVDIRSFVVMAGNAKFREQPLQVVMLKELRARLAAVASEGKTDAALRRGWRDLEAHRASATHRRDAAAHDAYMRARTEAAAVHT